MSTELDEAIDVEILNDAPSVIWWGGFPYVVVGPPLPFYRRSHQRWWLGEGDIDRIDTEFWRLIARRDRAGEPERMYDIRRDVDGWRLVLQWDD